LAAVGSTYEETEQLMREALEIHLASMREDGDPIPEPTTRICTVTVDVGRRKLAKSA
jgi:predicted RNase H-like HicB family nuclease